MLRNPVELTPMTYQGALDYLASLAPRGWRLGLDRMNELIRRADLGSAMGSSGAPRYIHVAGTNGKGSVTAYLQSMLVESGYSTGSFFSPFVYDPRERIQFNRHLIPENVFALLTQLLHPIAESLTDTEFGGITEFEFKTAVAFMFWKELECEWVALETGLGGRLDATNVVTPACSVIVSIGLDHTSILGNTLGEIATEKAGIIKQGVPVVVGELPKEAMGVIETTASSLEAPLWRLGKEIVLTEDSPDQFTIKTPKGEHQRLQSGIVGAKQPHNMALAVAAMDASGAGRTLKGYTEGCLLAYAPGRYEKRSYRGTALLLDGAHNAEAARALRQSLLEDPDTPDRIILLTGMVAGHDPMDFYRELVLILSGAHIAPINFHRAVPPIELGNVLRGTIPTSVTHEDAQEALNAAIDDAGPEGLVLVTGSFYLVGEIGNLIEREVRR